MSELQVKLPHSSMGGHRRNLGLFEWKTVLFSLVTAIFITPPESKILNSHSQGSFVRSTELSSSKGNIKRPYLLSGLFGVKKILSNWKQATKL